MRRGYRREDGDTVTRHNNDDDDVNNGDEGDDDVNNGDDGDHKDSDYLLLSKSSANNDVVGRYLTGTTSDNDAVRGYTL